MLLLRPLCRDYVLYVVATSFMMGLRPLCRSYLSPTSCMWGLRPVSIDYVLLAVAVGIVLNPWRSRVIMLIAVLLIPQWEFDKRLSIRYT